MKRSFFTDLELGPNCLACKLDKDCQSPKMKATGRGKKKILVIAEAPGEAEDKRGIQLIGKAGRLLRRNLDAEGIDLDNDCIKISAVNCRPANDKTPTDKQIEYCKPFVDQVIKDTKPELILLCGHVALKSFLMNKWKKKIKTVGTWVNFTWPDRESKSWVSCLYHPKDLLNNESKALKTVFTNGLKNALSHLDKKLPFFNDDKQYVMRLDEYEAKVILKGMINKPPKFAAFDYETTGLKPHKRGHKIVCCSISTSENFSCVFEIGNAEIDKLLVEILQSADIKKIAHNIKFEMMWSKLFPGIKIKGMFWDSQITAHILDKRSGISGLKFQTYINFGVPDYDSHIEHLLKTPGRGDGNRFNKLADEITDEEKNELMTYCALDSLYTFRLFLKQCEQIKASKNLRRANQLFFEGAKTFSNMEGKGIRINEAYYQDKEAEITKAIADKEVELHNDKHIKEWKREYGDKFKLDSGQQLAHILFDVMRLKSTRRTATDKASVDETTLVSLSKKVKWVDNLLSIRKLKKIRSTYINGILRESVNGIIRPFFHLNTVSSYRSSSSRPNFQNIPRRDKEAQKLVRDGIIPRDGNRIVELDYETLEVRISACIHKDPKMIEYINDPTTDMHRDTAQDLFLIRDESDVTPEIRFVAKNQFVFAQFYGDWYESCAKGMWPSLSELSLGDQPMKEHLSDQGIRSLDDFIEHVKSVEHILWKKRFKVYDKWKDKFYAEYERNGYIDLITGFRCSGYMRRNQILNLPIQGPAFHCLLWSLIQLDRAMRKEKMRGRIVGQIHDSGFGDIPDDEFIEFTDMATQIMTKDIRKHWQWLIVPLDIEIEACEINQPWSTKEKWLITKN